jgi:hypothetical protein
MRKNLYYLSIILLPLFQCNAGEYQFVSASPRLASQERMKLETITVVATREPARYGFQKSKGKTGYVADGAGSGARAVVEGGFGTGDGLLALGSIALSPFGAVVGAFSEGNRKLAPDALAESEADLTEALVEMARQSFLRDQLVKVARDRAGRIVTIRDDVSMPEDNAADYRPLHLGGVDAVLESTVQDIRLQRTGSRDSSYALFINTRVRLLRPDDGAVLYDHPFQYHSGTSLFVDWTLNHAEPFRVQVQSAYEKLAEKIVERVLLDPARDMPRQLDSRTLARNKPQKRPGNPPLLLAANSKQGTGHLIAANDWIAGLGTIGIVSTGTFPTISIKRPLRKTDASQELGEQFSALGGDEEAVQAFTAVTLGYGLPIIIAGGLIGEVAGKVAGVPQHRLLTADDALDRAIAESDMQEQLRTQVRKLVGERSDGRVVLVKKPLPEGVGPEFARLSCVRCGTLAWLPKGQSAQTYLTSQGIDTALEIQILNSGLNGNGVVNPSLALSFDVRASLIRVRDERELASVPLKYRSKKHKFTAWAANDARLLREEIQRCNDTLAEEIAREIFNKPGTLREAPSVRLAGSPQLQNEPGASEPGRNTDPIH